MAAPAKLQPSNRVDATDILAAISELGDRVERRFSKVETEMERRFSKVETEMERRFSKVETEMDRRFSKVEADIGKFDERFRKIETDVARIDGRVSQIPNLWQIAGLIFAIFGASFVLIHYASGH